MSGASVAAFAKDLFRRDGDPNSSHNEWKNDVLAALIFLPICWFGSHIQFFPHDYSQWMRWHFADLGNVPVAASIFNQVAGTVTKHSRPAVAAGAAFAAGTGFEAYQAFTPGHSFDFTDVGCYGAGVFLYLGIRAAVKGLLTPKP